MKNKFNLKQDTIFMSLVSHAMEILESDEIDKMHKDVLILAKHVRTTMVHNRKFKYTPAQKIKIAKELKNSVGVNVKEGVSSVILLIISLEYLIKEVKHVNACMLFSTHIKRIKELVYSLETTVHRDLLYAHYRLFIDGMLEGEEVPLAFINKHNENLIKAQNGMAK